MTVRPTDNHSGNVYSFGGSREQDPPYFGGSIKPGPAVVAIRQCNS